MPKPSVISSSSSAAVLQTLAWCRKQDFRAVPLHFQSKAAVSKKYVEPSYSTPSDSTWQSSNFGIGVVLGPSHSGPVDIDLDCPEAVALAPRFLPPTPAVFGRESKKASHWLYRVDASSLAKTALIDPLEKSTIVELRADGGHQTVLPGSLHQDTGELIRWEDKPFPDVPKVLAADLSKAVRNLAISVLIIRHLWHDGQRNEMVKHLAGLFYYLEWPEEDAASIIRAVTDYLQDDDKTRHLTVAATYRKAERGGKVTGAATLRKLVDEKLVDRILDWAGSPSTSVIHEYNERFATVLIGGKFRIADTDVSPSKPPVFMHKDDFLNEMGADRIEVDDKPVSKARVWLADPRRRRYRTLDFLPGIEDPYGVLNLWTGWAVLPQPEASCAAWLELLQTIICGDDQQANWLLNWFANIIRDPRAPSHTAPVLIGKQGAGKSLLLAYFGRILGEAYTVVTNDEHVYGRFNSHFATTLLLHSEEALFGGETKHKGIIKSLVTDEFRMFESKGVDARKVRNYLRLVLTSNAAKAAPAEAGDRRFCVFDLKDRILSDDLKQRVLTEMDGNGPAALHQFLLDFPYDKETSRVSLKNDALATMKSGNLEAVDAWWLGVLESGYLLPSDKAWLQDPAQAPWPERLGAVALFESMQNTLRAQNVRHIPKPPEFSNSLSRWVGRKLKRKQVWYDPPNGDERVRQHSIYNFPSLAECRLAFEATLGQTVDWPEDSDPEETPLYAKY